MQNHNIRKVTCIDFIHSDILYDQLSDLVGALFVMQVGRSIIFYDPPNETPMDKAKHKEIERHKHNAMAFEDEVTQEDIYNLMKEY